MQNKFDVKRIEENFRRVINDAPRILGNDAVNFFQDRFKQQGWVGNAFEPWRKRKKNVGKYRQILVKTGRLKRSVRITRIVGTTAHIGSDVPYAKMHNEGFKGTVNVPAHKRNKFSKSKVGTGKFTKSGKERMKTVSKLAGTITVKAHSKRINMPARRFMGNSPYLDKTLKRRLTAELLKGLRK